MVPGRKAEIGDRVIIVSGISCNPWEGRLGRLMHVTLKENSEVAAVKLDMGFRTRIWLGYLCPIAENVIEFPRQF